MARYRPASGPAHDARNDASLAEDARPRCLLAMPNTLFHYPGELCRALETMGYRVTLANDEYPNNPLGKALGKLDSPLSRWLTRRAFRRKFLDRRQWDLILIIKGRGVGPELVADMRRHARRIVGYHYDSLDYDRSTRRWSHLVDRISTFDRRDARENGWDLVPLFALEQATGPASEKTYFLSAVVRNHSNRLAYVDKVVRSHPGCSTFIYFYEKDILTLARNFVRSPALYLRWRKHIHRRPLPYGDFASVLASSEFSIDYAHPTQSGSTMRCIEARALGTKLVTNDRFIGEECGEDGLHVVYDGHSGTETLVAEMKRRIGHYPEAVSRDPVTFLTEVIGTDRPAVRVAR